MNWTDASSACASLDLDGYHDWRLPTIDELRSLARGCPATVLGGTCAVSDACLGSSCGSDACQGCAEFGGPSPEGCYRLANLNGDCMTSWTASVLADRPDEVWTVGFAGCHVLPYPKNTGLNTRCVR